MSHHKFRQAALVAAAAAGAALATMAAGPAPPTTAALVECPEVFVIGVHGVREKAEDKNLNMGPTVVKLYYKMVQKSGGAITLGAAGVKYKSNSFSDLALNTVISDKVATTTQAGADALFRLVDQHLQKCPVSDTARDSDILLVGYSQGAWVVDLFLHDNPTMALQIQGGAILFGDPQFYGLSSMSVGDDAALGSARFWGKYLDPYIWPVQVKDLEIRGFTRSYCITNDPVCDASNDPLDPVGWYNHIWGYSKAGGYMDDAAQFFYEKHVLNS